MTAIASETLYEITDLRSIIDAALEESGGELTPEIEAALGQWDAKFSDKAERVALYICEQESLAERARNAAKAITERAVARERRADSLKRYLLSQMQMAGKERIDGVLKTVAVQKNPASVRGELPQAELAAIYASGLAIVKQIPLSYVLDKKATLAAHTAGQELPAGLTVERGISLRIR